ncbi:MAG TPA: phospholipase [Bryobacteraceae bacterium]|jgi:predicted esterase
MPAWDRPRGRATARFAEERQAFRACRRLRSLHIRKTRDAQLYVPKAAATGDAAPLLMYLHGATGSEEEGIRRLREFSDDFGFILLSPGSTGQRWDAIRGEYGPDVRMLNAALERTFDFCNIDPKRVCVCGFSDGGSYALGIGLANGDLFRSLIAFSPGFVPAGFEPDGHPRIFISHGTEDRILPIDECSRRMVPEFKRRGYEVTFREFKGPHTVPHDICEEALRWFLNS